VAALGLQEQTNLHDPSMERILQVVSVIVSLSSVVAGFNIFKRRIILARNSGEPGKKRMSKYQAACITWWAMIEWPGVLAIVGYMLTGNFAFFAMALFHIVILLAFMPRKDNIVVLLQLNSTEVDQLEGKA
jgi:hypothetical protein